MTIKHRAKPPRWQRYCQYHYRRWMRLETSPTAFARGLAVGVFAGWFPFFGLQTILSVGLAAIVGGNKFIAAAGTWVSNPVTYLPIYYFNFELGRWLLGTKNQDFTLDSLQSWDTLTQLGHDFITAMFLGSFVAGLGAGGLAYGVGLTLAQRFYKS